MRSQTMRSFLCGICSAFGAPAESEEAPADLQQSSTMISDGEEAQRPRTAAHCEALQHPALRCQAAAIFIEPDVNVHTHPALMR